MMTAGWRDAASLVLSCYLPIRIPSEICSKHAPRLGFRLSLHATFEHLALVAVQEANFTVTS